MTRNYSFEALAEVTSTDWKVGRGQLNAALKLIREQSEEQDDYLLSCEIHERAKMYRAVFENAALTPTALAKHWKRVYEETHRRPKIGPPPELPKSSREENLDAAKKLLATLWGGKDETTTSTANGGDLLLDADPAPVELVGRPARDESVREDLGATRGG